ncbi:hypothetical protein BV25DRAFT_1820623 [Artomyces pyxidatus]|uniref:Uncharacterized protein n=1 Tax=Artomyces pyxidatus TaxID=48021 RepID=A0ACB8TDV6_9AGAM|nr:hypothetical protein BV25DRAFT_1820623 [Artomyces pyxidatus]
MRVIDPRLTIYIYCIASSGCSQEQPKKKHLLAALTEGSIHLLSSLTLDRIDIVFRDGCTIGCVSGARQHRTAPTITSGVPRTSFPRSLSTVRPEVVASTR